jgi:hypothetical protein
MRTVGAKLSDREMRTAILRDSKKYKSALRQVAVEFVMVPKLLAMDGEGRPLKGVWGGAGEPYGAHRIWPGGYRVRRRNRLAVEGCSDLDVIWSAASLDQIFGGLIWRISGFDKDDLRVWPGSVLQRGCADCRTNLALARGTAARLPPPPSADGDQEARVVSTLKDGQWVQAPPQRLLTTTQELAKWERLSRKRRR